MRHEGRGVKGGWQGERHSGERGEGQMMRLMDRGERGGVREGGLWIGMKVREKGWGVKGKGVLLFPTAINQEWN